MFLVDGRKRKSLKHQRRGGSISKDKYGVIELLKGFNKNRNKIKMHMRINE